MDPCVIANFSTKTEDMHKKGQTYCVDSQIELFYAIMMVTPCEIYFL